MSYYVIHWDGSVDAYDQYSEAAIAGGDICTVLNADELSNLMRRVEKLELE